MNPEIMRMRNELAYAHREIARIKEEAALLIPEIRDCLTPYGEDMLLKANIPGAKKKLKELETLKAALVKNQETAKSLSKELGEDE